MKQLYPDSYWTYFPKRYSIDIIHITIILYTHTWAQLCKHNQIISSPLTHSKWHCAAINFSIQTSKNSSSIPFYRSYNYKSWFLSLQNVLPTWLFISISNRISFVWTSTVFALWLFLQQTSCFYSCPFPIHFWSQKEE